MGSTTDWGLSPFAGTQFINNTFHSIFEGPSGSMQGGKEAKGVESRVGPLPSTSRENASFQDRKTGTADGHSAVDESAISVMVSRQITNFVGEHLIIDNCQSESSSWFIGEGSIHDYPARDSQEETGNA